MRQNDLNPNQKNPHKKRQNSKNFSFPTQFTQSQSSPLKRHENHFFIFSDCQTIYTLMYCESCVFLEDLILLFDDEKMKE